MVFSKKGVKEKMDESERKIWEDKRRREEAEREKFGNFVSDELDIATMDMVDEYFNHTTVDFK